MLNLIFQPDEYRAALQLLKTGHANLLPSTTDIPEILCYAEGMKKYREKLSELDALLEQYKVLLQKDQTAMQSVRNQLINVDKLLSNSFSPSP